MGRHLCWANFLFDHCKGDVSGLNSAMAASAFCPSVFIASTRTHLLGRVWGAADAPIRDVRLLTDGSDSG